MRKREWIHLLAEFINRAIRLLHRLADGHHHIHKLVGWPTGTWNLQVFSTAVKIQLLPFLSQVGKSWNSIFFPRFKEILMTSLFVPSAVLGGYSPDRSLNPMMSCISWKPLIIFQYPVFIIMGNSTTVAVFEKKKKKSEIFAFGQSSPSTSNLWLDSWVFFVFFQISLHI